MKALMMTAVLGLILGSSAFAKEDFKERHPRRAEVNERVRNERKRIAEGVKSGKITPAQAKQMYSELDGVKGEEKSEVKANGGYLTKTEQKQLNGELNQDSKQINTDEKDAGKHPRRTEVNDRVANERKRIAEGVKSGEITPAEAKQLNSELDGVKGEEHAEVKANGGYLTKPEQKQLNGELNQDSKQIYDDKHPAAPVASTPASGN